VATEESEVQTYDAKDTPAKNLGKVNSQAEADALTTKDQDDPAEQRSGDAKAAENAAAAAPKPAARKSTAK